MSAEEDTEYLKLPVEERCVHKQWKARQNGFEECVKLFKRWDGEDPNWKKYSPIIKKFVNESNAIVLETGLEATLAYAENCDAAPKNASEIMDGVICKCLGSAKTKTRDLAKQLSLMLCEIEAHEKVVEELIKGLAQKNPKVVSGCLTVMADILRSFGAKVIKVSPLLKAAIPLLDHRDKAVRDEGKVLIIESYRWVGALMKQQLAGVKPVQMTELEAEFEKVQEAGKAKPERYLRSQMAQAAAVDTEQAGEGEENDAGGDEKDGGNDEEMDPFEMIDPVDILPQLPKNFYELCEEKKWQLRKEALDALLPLSNTPKISNGDFNDLVRVLKKFVAKDTNVMLVALAAQCLAGLAKGLRAQFKNHATQCLPVILEKFKEKKANVVTALVEVTDALYPCLGIESLQEDCLAMLKHKTPSVNEQTAKYLARCFAKCPPQLVENKKVLKGYVCALLEKLAHPDVTVRDASSEALGVLLKFLGENALGKLMIDVDAIKMAKIKEFEEKAVLTGKPAAAVKPKAAPAKNAPKPVVRPKTAPEKKPASASTAAKKKVTPKASPEPELDNYETEDKEEEMEAAAADNLPRVDISEKMSEAFLAKLSDKDWKLRKEGMDELKEILNSAKFVSGNVGGLSPVLATRFSDTNKIISVAAIEIAKDLAVAMGPHVKGQLSFLLPALMSSLCDSKPNVRASVVGCLETILDQTLLREFFSDEMIITALNKGNPFAKQEIFKFLTVHLPTARNVNKEELNACLPVLYAAIEDRNADVRKAAQESVEAFMRHLGFGKMSSALDRCKPGTKGVIAPLLDKARENVPQPEPPKRAGGAKSAPAAGIRGGGKPAMAEKKAGAKLNLVSSSRPRINTYQVSASKSTVKKGEDIDPSPLFVASNLKNARFKDELKLKVLKWNFATPRQEFVDQLKEQMTNANVNKTLMAQMYHSDFKQHLNAIESMSAVVVGSTDTEALMANLDLVLKWMTLRFFETNPSVLFKGLEFLQEVFNMLAEESYHLHDLEASAFIPYLINKVGDPKDPVRNIVKNILKTLVKVYPASKMSMHLLNGLGCKNAKQRTECLDELGFLVRGFGTGVLQQPTVSACLKDIAKQIADRDNSVRSAALNCMAEVYFQDGEKMYKAVGNLPEKDMAMLEERIKRESKKRPPPEQMQQQQQQPQQQQSNNHNNNPQQPASRIGAPAGRLRQALGTNGQNNPPPSVRNNTSPIKSRPISGAFTLDFDRIESAMEQQHGDSGSGGLRLVNHNLEEIFNDEPVQLPHTLTGRNNRQQHMQQQRTYGQQQQQQQQHVTNDLSEMSEAYEAVDLVLAQIFNQDSTVCITALVQLDELMKDKEKVVLLGKRMDQLFVACYMQYRHVLTSKLKTDNYDPREVMRLFQYLTMVLMSAFHHAELTKNASMSSLHDLVHIIICILLEPEVQSLPEGGQLVRALNVLTVKIVERSDHTNVASAFLKLLKEGIGNAASLSPKYVELVMKCLWKIIRLLPQWNDDLGLDVLLCDLHDFLKAFPSAYWKKQEVDTPMRTVKTVLHSLAKMRGEEIMDHLTKVQDPEGSELVPYLRKLLNTGIGKENNNSEASAAAAAAAQQQLKKRTTPPARFSKSDHETLAEIFKKIGQKEQTKQGLQELYNFKQQNPQADLEPFLAKSSQYFRDYIERGLNGIEHDMQGLPPDAKSARFASLTSTSSVLSDNGNNQQPQQQQQQQPYSQYLDRLKKLREQGGLDREQQQQQAVYRIAATAATATIKQEMPPNPFEEPPTPQMSEASSAATTDVEDIRKRLERIKQSAF